jgi:hypothetical protein
MGSEPQLLVSAPKYSWIKSQIPALYICCEGVYFVCQMSNLNLAAYLMSFYKNKLMTPDFSFTLPHLTSIPHIFTKIQHVLIFDMSW